MPQNQPAAPKQPNPSKLYKEGINLQLQYLPQLLAAEQTARSQYDPQRIAEQQALQDKYGPKQVQQQLDALHQIDPSGTAVREQLGANVSRDLALGSQLTPEMETQLDSYIRGAESARGNVLGNAPASAEALWKGQAALNLYQKRLENAGNFVSGPTPEQQLIAVQPVTADRTSSYVNPNAGLQNQQFGLQNYQNALAQYQLSGGGRNVWGSALGGAASGALAGSSFGPYGAGVGAVVGGVGGYFSDPKTKTGIRKIGNIGLYRYKSRLDGKDYVGPMSTDIKRVIPSAVSKRGGFDFVDGDQVGIAPAEVAA